MTGLAQPLELGKLTLANRLVQAPLAGYSAAPFRVLTQRYGKPAFTCTEMISGHDLAHRTTGPYRYLWRDPEEDIVCFQISGHDPEKIASATQKVTKAGADIVDLNCGCPVKKIRTKKQGSKLLADPTLLSHLIRTMKDNTDAVVSIKIRVGEPEFDSVDLEVAQAAEEAGVDFMTVHGRHWTEKYDKPVRTSPIAAIKQAVTIPIIANGDVACIESANRVMQETGADGLMIARASVGDPWLFQEILQHAQGKDFVRPSLKEVGEVFREHIQRLIQLDNEKLAILQSRKLAKYYARFMQHRTEYVVQAQLTNTAQEQFALIDQFFNE